jgi:hypothetical protein
MRRLLVDAHLGHPDTLGELDFFICIKVVKGVCTLLYTKPNDCKVSDMFGVIPLRHY